MADETDQPQLQDYLRLTLSHDHLQLAMRSWRWLGIDGLVPRAATLFGDLILEGHGGWWFLSTIEGTLTRPWLSQEDCEASLATEDGMQDYLGAGIVDLAADAGFELGPDEVIGFEVPPLFGAGLELGNLRATKFLVVHLFMSQLHRHTRAADPEPSVAQPSHLRAVPDPEPVPLRT